MTVALVLSEPDPVARAVAERLGPGEATGAHVDGAPVRALAPGVLAIKRAVAHVRDDDLDLRLPSALRGPTTTLVFPSVHRSESGRPCFTVHPLGNLGPRADVGGRPRTLVPSAPRLMADLLRRLSEAGDRHGLPATYEATHHGPALSLPALFAEIGADDPVWSRRELTAALAEALRSAEEDPRDRVALGAGGGHYVPRFSDLARRRRWAFGHLLPSHALDELDDATAEAATRATPGCEGVVFARAADAERPIARALGPRLRETDAPPVARDAPV
jgi:D-aminoacyl-tRNA deacylase